MASAKQIAANRVNARRSTGPRTRQGKSRSRRNALRHGLGAATIVDVFETADDYRTFERRIIRTYQPKSPIEQELVLRLVSLLWRLRRATTIEKGLFDLHARLSSAVFDSNSLSMEGDDMSASVYRHLKNNPSAAGNLMLVQKQHSRDTAQPTSRNASPNTCREFSNAFLRLSNLSGESFDRLRRYEVTLWRQAAQTILLLRSATTESPNVVEIQD